MGWGHPMRRAFTLQLHKRIDLDECIGGDCPGPGTNPLDNLITMLDVMCRACAARRLGLSTRRTSGWWPMQPIPTQGTTSIHGKRIDYIVLDDLDD